MRRHFPFLVRLWKMLVFVVTIRAVTRPYRSPRLHLADR